MVLDNLVLVVPPHECASEQLDRLGFLLAKLLNIMVHSHVVKCLWPCRERVSISRS